MPLQKNYFLFDFGAIWTAVRSQKKAVFLFVLTFLLFGVFLSSLRTPMYKAEVLLLPPTESDLVGLILARIPLSRSDSPEIFDLLDSVEIFRKFKLDLASRPYQLSFFQEFVQTSAEGIPFSPEYSRTSADGFSSRLRGKDFGTFSTEWRLQRTRYLHWPTIGIGDTTATISVDSDLTSSRHYILVAFSFNNSIAAADYANKFVDFVNQKTTEDVKQLLQTGLDIRRRNIEDMIRYQRKLAHETTNDYVERIKEAISIAKSLDIKKPTDAFGGYNLITINPPPQFFLDPRSNDIPRKPHESQKYLPLYHPGNITQSAKMVGPNTQIPPLYTRGWLALEQELKAITNRKSLDPFIPNLRDLKNQLTWMNSVKPDEIVLSATHIAHRAIPPSESDRINSKLFVFLFSLAGILAGIFYAIVNYAIKQNSAKSIS